MERKSFYRDTHLPRSEEEHTSARPNIALAALCTIFDWSLSIALTIICQIWHYRTRYAVVKKCSKCVANSKTAFTCTTSCISQSDEQIQRSALNELPPLDDSPTDGVLEGYNMQKYCQKCTMEGVSKMWVSELNLVARGRGKEQEPVKTGGVRSLSRLPNL